MRTTYRLGDNRSQNGLANGLRMSGFVVEVEGHEPDACVTVFHEVDEIDMLDERVYAHADWANIVQAVPSE